ncbi:MAG: DNRLRE domain-containing protein [Patescibacteria group bacterium]
MKKIIKHKKKGHLILFVSLGALVLTTVTALVLSQQSTQLLTQAETTTTNVAVVEDAFVSASNPTRNYGTDAALKVDLDKKTYVKFDLAALAGQPISSAVLRVYVINNSSSTQEVKEVLDNNWNESAITFDNQPSIGATVGQLSNTDLNTWREIDLTSYVGQKAGQVMSLAIDATGTNSNNLYLSSQESANAPVLIVQTETGSQATPIPTTSEPSSVPTTEITQQLTATPTVVSPTVGATEAPTATPTPITGARNINVTNATELTSALSNAQPGDVITMADGIYKGKIKSTIPVGTIFYTASFIIAKSGTPTQPIVLQGTRNARIDGGGLGGYYGLYLITANYVHVKGITIENANKGLILDKSNNNLLEDIEVKDIHDEGIHFRAISSDNILKNSYVHHIGRNKTTGVIDNHYGEGVYVGSANSSNWCTYSNCQPDTSDRNQLINNTINNTGGENIDVKEGTSQGLIQNNILGTGGIPGKNADSWVDIKGNNWSITGNQGIDSIGQGYEVHGVLTGWGINNTFTNNSATNVAQYGFWVQNNVTGNVISCNNTVTNAGSGFSNVPCVNQ